MREDTGDYASTSSSFHPKTVSAVCYAPPIPTALNVAIQATGAVVTGCVDGIVRVHDTDCNQLFELHGHTANVGSVAVTPDGKYLISGSWTALFTSGT